MTEPTQPSADAATYLLTNEQRDNFNHCTQHRNLFCGSADDPGWLSAVGSGMAEVRKVSWVAPSVYYRVTPKGRAALAHDMALAVHGEPSNVCERTPVEKALEERIKRAARKGVRRGWEPGRASELRQARHEGRINGLREALAMCTGEPPNG